MRKKMGNVLPKTGNVLHRRRRNGNLGVNCADVLATALKKELGSTHRAIKLAMRWTDASERTVKYWFAGAGVPSGEHLIALAQHSDVVLVTFLQLANRPCHAAALRIIQACEQIHESLEEIRSLTRNS
jgi:hypothetical protein